MRFLDLVCFSTKSMKSIRHINDLMFFNLGLHLYPHSIFIEYNCIIKNRYLILIIFWKCKWCGRVNMKNKKVWENDREMKISDQMSNTNCGHRGQIHYGRLKINTGVSLGQVYLHLDKMCLYVWPQYAIHSPLFILMYKRNEKVCTSLEPMVCLDPISPKSK